MKPEFKSKKLLGITRAKAKMYEYDVPEDRHIDIAQHPSKLFRLALGIIGELAAQSNKEELDEEYLNELRESLLFSAHYFDSYLESKLEEDLSSYMVLVGAAAYYLCDLPGSSQVLANRINTPCPDLESNKLDCLLLWLLKGEFSEGVFFIGGQGGPYQKYINALSGMFVTFQKNGSLRSVIHVLLSGFRKFAYDRGTPRELLFVDIICALVKKRINNSTWVCLPSYSQLPLDSWREAIGKPSFIAELWPAQKLLGEQGVLSGKSAIVQMPTSAGKTRSTELIIRSAFYSGRAELAVIVAPFRALCREIQDSLREAFAGEEVSVDVFSDVLQDDFEIEGLLERKQVVVVTPEKLVYVLRHSPELADSIGLLVYDEGHQFDSGSRGITYELLLTALKQMVADDSQVVLISAVITNADQIGHWLIGEERQIVSGQNLTPTYRSLAFASWKDRLGQLKFVDPQQPDTDEFFVPRVLKEHILNRKPRERSIKFFPDNKSSSDVALFLGLNAASKGSVAVFCGQKSTVGTICSKAVDIFEREIPLPKPSEISESDEVARLHNLYKLHFGDEAIPTKSAALGIYSHHGNTPQGIRLAVEFAMQNGDVKFVVCTSTLAQGVNLPIRYLIVTGVYQAGKQIKVRDFHNLIGRAGRAGMHTEGSILFTDHTLYDKRELRTDRWRWNVVKQMLNADNSEACDSSLLALIQKPLTNSKGDVHLQMGAPEFVRQYIGGKEALEQLIMSNVEAHSAQGFTESSLRSQVQEKAGIVSALESYLMAHWEDYDGGLSDENSKELAEGTLAHHLSSEDEKAQIVEIFILLSQNINEQVPDDEHKSVFGKTLFGVPSALRVEEWAGEHLEQLVQATSEIDLVEKLWEILSLETINTKFRTCSDVNVLQAVALKWIEGKPFVELSKIFQNSDVRVGLGRHPRKVKMDQTVEICEGVFAYEFPLILSALVEIVAAMNQEENLGLLKSLQKLQKKFKYGLPSSLSIGLHEIGFADRIVALDLSMSMNVQQVSRHSIIRELKTKKPIIGGILSEYPKYYQKQFADLVN